MWINYLVYEKSSCAYFKSSFFRLYFSFERDVSSVGSLVIVGWISFKEYYSVKLNETAVKVIATAHISFKHIFNIIYVPQIYNVTKTKYIISNNLSEKTRKLPPKIMKKWRGKKKIKQLNGSIVDRKNQQFMIIVHLWIHATHHSFIHSIEIKV